MTKLDIAISGLEQTAGYFRHLQSIGFFGDQEIFYQHERNCNTALELLKELQNDGLKHYDDGSVEP